ncbi:MULTISPECIES: dihydroorotate dehydrogenase [Clostridium]|uniref:Dihydroorotate dehydrogenase n=1 Tax=Clostridium lapidicellarium TaxID=3240931 RepID=A0ABV4DT46_9CLOT|nr:dihydroorotate dehydrogenase [uncultured Clostridium sp.]NLU08136.1 dihydroorotate dehydrogenase [Clostridiales bacterium]
MNTSVNIGSLKLRNPIMNASGTFGLDEYDKYIDFSKIGALVAKSVTRNPKQGNRPPRIVEVDSGVLNCVGLQNTGVLDFVENKIPKLRKIDTNIIVSISNHSVEDFKASAQMLDKVDGAAGYEINVSCPNVEEGGKTFGQSSEQTYNVVRTVRDIIKAPIIVKLTPNVTDIVPIAKAAVEAGADGLTVANTYIGMAVDLDTKKPVLGNIIGGLSGAAVKPLTLRLVYNIHKALDIPIVASGGVYTAGDALEYLLVGATAVQVGTANFIKPDIMTDIVEGIKKFMIEKNIEDINDFIGSLIK